MGEHPMEGRPQGDLSMTDADSERLRTVLADVAPDRTSAGMLLEKIDLVVHRLPTFQGSPDQFWFEVFQMLEAGVVDMPFRRLLGVSLARYPANKVLRDLHERYVVGRDGPGADAAGPGPGRSGVMTLGAGRYLDGPRSVETTPTVYLAHGEEVTGAVRVLVTVLKTVGFEPWLGSDVALGGRRRDVAARQAIRACDFFVPCVSKAALVQPGTLYSEIRLAVDRAKELPEDIVFVVPVRLDDCTIPPNLAEYHHVDLFAPDGIDRLLQALRV